MNGSGMLPADDRADQSHRCRRQRAGSRSAAGRKDIAHTEPPRPVTRAPADRLPLPGAEPALTDPAFVLDLRSQMLRFARLQLGQSDLAEDAVQEALAGAMQNAHSFGGRAAFKTWVFAILKHKIADVLRQRQRQRQVEAGQPLPSDEEGDDCRALFDQGGHWEPDEYPQTWADPEAAAHDQQFWRVFEACLDRLPGQQARVFMMREFIGLEAGEICTEVGITVSNLHVILHRARLHLRECLEDKWFLAGERSC
jgi:RNA polymerase sigma-70 factor (ECF subfamily)